MQEPTVAPHLFIILGATGDLTRRKLLPALYHLRDSGNPEKPPSLILGAALPEMTDEAFRLWAYEGVHEAGWRNAKHIAQWRATLATYAYPVIGEIAVGEVDTGLVLKIVESIWTTKPETASRLRGRNRHNKTVNFDGTAAPGELVPNLISPLKVTPMAGFLALID